MKFSEFAHMIYSYDTKGSKQSDFVIFLTNQIMEKTFTEDDEQTESKDKYNPLAKLDPNTLEKIFNGSRNISRKNAKVIRAHLNKDKFDEYIIKEFNYEAIDYFCETLKKAGISITDNEVSRACADTFENILTDLVNGTSKQSRGNYMKGFMDGVEAAIEAALKHMKPQRIKVRCGSTPPMISSSCEPTPMISSSCEPKKD